MIVSRFIAAFQWFAIAGVSLLANGMLMPDSAHAKCGEYVSIAAERSSFHVMSSGNAASEAAVFLLVDQTVQGQRPFPDFPCRCEGPICSNESRFPLVPAPTRSDIAPLEWGLIVVDVRLNDIDLSWRIGLEIKVAPRDVPRTVFRPPRSSGVRLAL